MNMTVDTLDNEVATATFPDLPSQGWVVVKQALGHTPQPYAGVLLDRVVSRSAYGARKFGNLWLHRDNTLELVEETSDSIVYSSQETARVLLGETPISPQSGEARLALEHLSEAARHAALADVHGQLAGAAIYGSTEPDRRF